MSTTAVILLVISAFTHAGWNFISKREHPPLAFYLVANTIGVICVLPIILYHWNQISLIPWSVWIFVIMSGFFLAAYFAAIAGAYRNGDMSIAYPLARSLPVIFVLIITLFLERSHEFGLMLLAGSVLVVTGCIILPMKVIREFHFSNYRNLCCLLAVLAAVGISGYTVTDDRALRYLGALPGMPFSVVGGTLVYMVFEGVSCSLWTGLFVLLSRRERKSIVEMLRASTGSAVLTGIGIYLTYGLVLVSMNYVTNVSYVAAFRQLSIPLGAVFGMVLLKEPRYAPKIMGIVIIFIGLIFVGTG